MLYFDIAIIAGEIAGLVLSIEKHGFWKQFLYYTQWSNYLLFLITIVHLICLLRERGKRGKEEGPEAGLLDRRDSHAALWHCVLHTELSADRGWPVSLHESS